MNNVDIDTWLGNKVDEIIQHDGFKAKAIAMKTGMPESTFYSKRKGYSPFTFTDIFGIARATGHRPSEFLPPEFSDDQILRSQDGL
jgi:predicted transcriptional regulator